MSKDWAISLEGVGVVLGLILTLITLLGYHRRIVSKEDRFEHDITGIGTKADSHELTLGQHETSIDNLDSRMTRLETEKDNLIRQAGEMKGALDAIQAEQKFIQKQMSADKLEIMVTLTAIQSDIRNLHRQS